MTAAAPLMANMGAHRLAWWLATERRRLARLERRARLGAGTVERLVTGKVLPADDVAAAIAAATAGAVRPEDWDMAGGTIGQRPAPRRA